MHTKVFLQEDLRLRTTKAAPGDDGDARSGNHFPDGIFGVFVGTVAGDSRRWVDYLLIAVAAMSVRADSGCETFPTARHPRRAGATRKRPKQKNFGLVG
jgi:hypothetical protein